MFLIIGKDLDSGLQVYKMPSSRFNMSRRCMTRSSTKELFAPLDNPERVFRLKRRLFETPGLVESNSPEFDLFPDIEERLEEETGCLMMTLEGFSFVIVNNNKEYHSDMFWQIHNDICVGSRMISAFWFLYSEMEHIATYSLSKHSRSDVVIANLCILDKCDKFLLEKLRMVGKLTPILCPLLIDIACARSIRIRHELELKMLLVQNPDSFGSESHVMGDLPFRSMQNQAIALNVLRFNNSHRESETYTVLDLWQAVVLV
ncbi:hypothetical protein Tco_0525411 [Tanacetum coccineum]